MSAAPTGAVIMENSEETFVKQISRILAAAVLGSVGMLGTTVQLARAQEAPPPPPPSVEQPAPVYDVSKEPNCGSWETGTWVPNGSCGPQDYRGRITGTITEVKGHLVTIQQTKGSLVINDQPALDQRTTGKVAVGRQVVAVGYWRAGVFYATRLV
jgi:hypothetical protein